MNILKTLLDKMEASEEKAESTKSKMSGDTNVCSELLGLLFHSRTQTHIWHLQTKSYAEHKALNKYYDGILDLTDQFAEAYSGEFGDIMTPKSFDFVDYSEKILTEHLEDVKEGISKAYSKLEGYTALQNKLDEMTDLVSTVIYLLRLK